MTDDPDRLSADLEAISRSLPKETSGFDELKTLLARLPQPTPPDLLSARAGVTPDAQVAGTFGASSSPLTGAPIGSESGGSIGVFADQTAVQANALIDATFHTIPQSAGYVIAAGPGWTQIGWEWQARYTLLSGTPPAAGMSAGLTIGRESNPYALHSGLLALSALPDANTYSILVEFEPVDNYTPGTVTFANMVAAFRLGGGTPWLTSYGTQTAVVQLYQGGVLAASSSPLNLVGLAQRDFRRLAAALSDTPANLSGTFYKPRLAWTVTKTIGTVQAASLNVAEPQLSAAPTQSPPPFTPLIAGWTDGGRKSVEIDIDYAHILGWHVQRFEDGQLTREIYVIWTGAFGASPVDQIQVHNVEPPSTYRIDPTYVGANIVSTLKTRTA